MVGYSSGQKGYRLVDKNYRVFISRNVKFLSESEESEVDLINQEEGEPSIYKPSTTTQEIRVQPARKCKQVSAVIKRSDSAEEKEETGEKGDRR